MKPMMPRDCWFKNGKCSMLYVLFTERQRPIECLSFLPSDLHANYGVDEEEHSDEQADVGQGFEGLHEGPQKDPDGVTLSQQFDQTSSPEQFQETHVECIDKLAKEQEYSIHVYINT